MFAKVDTPKSFTILSLCLLTVVPASCFAAEKPAPIIPEKICDTFIPAKYQQDDHHGYLPRRMLINLEKRLLTLNSEHILNSYLMRSKGSHAWSGEHVGKFLHAACLILQYNNDQRLRKKTDHVAKTLISTQTPDGYLGTKIMDERWSSWDVWAHKYNLIGLLSYYQLTDYQPALTACQKIGDLLCNTFGPGKRDIAKTGEHVGMAATSVLEPMVMLYRYTGQQRYLDFCLYIVQAWDQPHGPKIISSLLEHKNVFKTANNKAYEMLSNLVGLLELYRVTGNSQYLTTCRNAWNDIKEKRLYLSGTTSWHEHFKDDFELNPEAGVGEACVTVTWMQLNWHLLRLSGNLAYADQIERTVYNALLAAESPQNAKVCYFTPLNGKKLYGAVSHGIPGICCCSSSLPRGIALIPSCAVGTVNKQPAVLLYLPGKYQTTADTDQGPVPVTIDIKTDYPEKGVVNITVTPVHNACFDLLLRIPDFCSNYHAEIDGQTFTSTPGSFVTLDRTFQSDDKVTINMDMTWQLISIGSNQIACQRGPQLLTWDHSLTTPSFLPHNWIGKQIYNFNINKKPVILVPFADAGQTNSQYQTIFNIKN